MTQTDSDKIKLEPEWKAALKAEFGQPYMQELRGFLRQEAAKGKTVYPRGGDIFNAFSHTPLSKVKVVIIGQDPYHGPGQAHGLSFSVRDGVPPPPSLKNIYKELHEDIGVPVPKTGNLTPWADQGVLLLNAVLTVEEASAGSHRKRGWEQFTDRVIQVLSDRDDPIVFILWGAFAQSKAGMIRQPPHAVIKSAHPSPLSAHNGFWGSKPFSRTNAFLEKWGKTPHTVGIAPKRAAPVSDPPEDSRGRIEGSRDRERASLALEIPVESFANLVRVIVLQHPQEPDKVLGSAALLVRALTQAELRVGLSWRNLKAVAGVDALPAEWAVLYLGSKGQSYPEPVNFVSQKGNPMPMPPGLRGLIVLDGTWSQAKALWWRNSWLLKLKRVVLQPGGPSRYGNLRREPRAEALSTIESCALALEKMDPQGRVLRTHLEDSFQRMLDAYRARRGAGRV